MQVLSGRLRFTVDGEDLDAGAGVLAVHGARYAARPVASEPTVMLLTLVTGGRGWSGGRMMVAVVGEERCRG